MSLLNRSSRPARHATRYEKSHQKITVKVDYNSVNRNYAMVICFWFGLDRHIWQDIRNRSNKTKMSIINVIGWNDAMTACFCLDLDRCLIFHYISLHGHVTQSTLEIDSERWDRWEINNEQNLEQTLLFCVHIKNIINVQDNFSLV